jgi:hypothetical protein
VLPACAGRKLSQAQQAAAMTGYHNPKPLITVEPHLLVDQKNEKSLLQGGDVVFANGARIPLPGGIPLPTTGLWHQLLDIPQVCSLCTPLHTANMLKTPCSNAM